ncbi:hypothetical protein JQC79_19145 [Ochrobactrum anthropi]|uniref:hypothetical protein n=1 Tax=Brucella anthropi TaxID=529 RepID=UPI00194F33A2|nr:hypothetical protein [Brucella anthropi]MBM6397871.1 hypothetical protein [Brucella anthropi]QTN04640.1 hypothetical protein GTN27_15565 [Ochrobactrum sp. EEELCW01]
MTTVPEEAVKAADIIQVITDLRLAILQDDDEGLAEHAEPMIKAKELISKLSALPNLPQGVGVKVKPLDWTEDSAPGYRLFSAQSDIGHFAYGTDVDGNPWSSSPLGIKDHANEEAAKRAAEKAHHELVVDQAKAIGLELSALEPSAARELALEEIIALCRDYGEDSQPDSEYRLACNDIIEAIQERRALSSPDHADAGKVEGDGWLPIESAPRGTAPKHWDAPSILVTDGQSVDQAEWEADDGEPYWHATGGKRKSGNFLGYEPTHWRHLPSAPSREVAK